MIPVVVLSARHPRDGQPFGERGSVHESAGDDPLWAKRWVKSHGKASRNGRVAR
jgi:hypothetical protein